jgi:hypothetical protein
MVGFTQTLLLGKFRCLAVCRVNTTALAMVLQMLKVTQAETLQQVLVVVADLQQRSVVTHQQASVALAEQVLM